MGLIYGINEMSIAFEFECHVYPKIESKFHACSISISDWLLFYKHSLLNLQLVLQILRPYCTVWYHFESIIFLHDISVNTSYPSNTLK